MNESSGGGDALTLGDVGRVQINSYFLTDKQLSTFPEAKRFGGIALNPMPNQSLIPTWCRIERQCVSV